MTELMNIGNTLPSKIEDLAKFVLIGRDQLNMVRAGIKALDKLDMAKDVREQKKQEAQMLAEALMDAEVRIGEILLAMPKASGGDRKSEKIKSNSNVTFEKDYQQPTLSHPQPVQTKEQAVKQLGFDKIQVSRFQTLAQHKDLVEQVKQEARANDDLATRTAVLQAVKYKDKEEKKEHIRVIVEEAKKQEAIENPYNNLQEMKKGWYRIGKQYLYCGSNTDSEFINKLPKCAFGFADPPYNANVDEWDSNFRWEQDFLQNIADIVAVTPGGWNAYNFYNETKMNYIWEMFCWINNGMTHGKCGFANVIKTSIFSKGKVKIPQDFWQISIKINTTEDTKHKGRKPYEYMVHLLDLFSKSGDSIVDCFAGSGTTLILCEKMNRISYNAELNEEYCRDIIKRSGVKDYEYLGTL
jgi:16S rRNA G966 N2-methylase RsmD